MMEREYRLMNYRILQVCLLIGARKIIRHSVIGYISQMRLLVKMTILEIIIIVSGIIM